MECPYCEYPKTKTLESRTSNSASIYRSRNTPKGIVARLRECPKCHRRFDTEEVVTKKSSE